MNINEIFTNVDKLFENKQSDQVEPYLLSCLKEAESAKDLSAVIPICNELGGFYRAIGRYDEGVLLYEKALSAISALGLDNTQHHATTLMNYATTYAVDGRSDKALALFDHAAKIFQGLGLSADYRAATLHNNMSILCQDTGDLDSALSHLHSALEVLKDLPESEPEIAITYTNMAQIHLQSQNNDAAIESAKKSLEIFDSSCGDSDVHYGAALETLGQIYLAQESYEDALSCFEKAQSLTLRDYGAESLAYESVSSAIAECRKIITQGEPEI